MDRREVLASVFSTLRAWDGRPVPLPYEKTFRKKITRTSKDQHGWIENRTANKKILDNENDTSNFAAL